MRNIKKNTQVQMKVKKEETKCYSSLSESEQVTIFKNKNRTNIYFSLFQTSDEFLDKLLQTDATLDEGTVPDIKVMDNDMGIMSGDEVNASSLLDFFNQLTSKSNSNISNANIPIKEEPLSEDDLKALQKDRQKKDNHNLSKFQQMVSIFM